MSKAILIALVLGIGAGVVMSEGVSGFLDTASSYMLADPAFFRGH